VVTETQPKPGPLSDPVAFADPVYGQDWGHDELNLAPESYAEVNCVMHELEGAVPALADREAPASRIWSNLSDAIYALAGDTASAGKRVGGADEAFRRTIVPPTRICPDCLNVSDDPRNRATCTRCTGTGVVAR